MLYQSLNIAMFLKGSGSGTHGMWFFSNHVFPVIFVNSHAFKGVSRNLCKLQTGIPSFKPKHPKRTGPEHCKKPKKNKIGRLYFRIRL